MQDGTTFKEKGFCIIRKTLSEELLSFLTEYYCNKAEVYKTKLRYNFVNRYDESEGTLNDEQTLNSYSIYGDISTDMILVKLKPLIEKYTGLKLQEQYSYMRVYKKGDVLEKHTDRFSCEISATLNLGCDKIWPFYLERENKPHEILLGAGDLLIYRGDKYSHWRNKFEGEACIQTFLHYNNIESTKQKYDSRPHLGLPHWFKGR